MAKSVCMRGPKEAHVYNAQWVLALYVGVATSFWLLEPSMRLSYIRVHKLLHVHDI